ncbi:MAG: serine hydrolase domain-containing protein, partial [Pseudomonadota bacterium]
MQGDAAIFLKTTGHYDLQQTRPLTPDAQFQVGSITKGLVGTLAGLLASRGDLDLGKPIVETLGNASIDQTSDKAKITLLHLLTHHAGLSSNPPNRKNIPVPAGLPEGVDPTIWAPYSIGELRDGFSQAKLRSVPGTQDYYSNFGFHLAATVIATEQGKKSVKPLMRSALFDVV